jgi:porin
VGESIPKQRPAVIDEEFMIRVGCHKWGLAVLVPGVLALLALSPTRAEAQDPSPVIIPGLPGANLPAGARPAPTAWPYTDLPGGRSATTAEPPADTTEAPADTTEAPTDTTESPPPAAPPYGLTGNWFGARDSLFDYGIDLRTDLSQFYQGTTSGGLRQTFPYGLKFDYFGTIEAEKLVGWEGLFINLHGESRFGESINGSVGSCQLRPRVPQVDGQRLGLDQHADRAVPGTRFRRHLRQAQRRRRRQHPPVLGRQRHQSLHE